jgi:hypothetical protein
VARGRGGYRACSSTQFQDAGSSRDLHVLQEEAGSPAHCGIEHMGTKLDSKVVQNDNASFPNATMSKLQHRRGE